MKHMDGVDHVMWSEEVFSVPVDPEMFLAHLRDSGQIMGITANLISVKSRLC